MKQALLTTLLLAASLVFATAPATVSQAQNQERPPLNIAVINTQQVGQQASGLQAARERLEQIRQGIQQTFNQRANAIRQQAQQLSARESVMPPAVFQQQQRQLGQEMANLRQQYQQQQQALAQAWQEQVAQVFQRTLVEIVQELAVERGYTLVIERSAALFNSPSYDITDTVVERFNQRMPQVEFNYENPSDQNGQSNNEQ
jgi:Skp family chaperone for outer membrane proteins